MKKISCLLALAALFSVCTFAQDAAVADVFLGYSFLRANSSQNIPAFSNNGGVGTVAYNITDNFGLEAEFGGYHNGNVNNYQFDTSSFSFLFGPRVSLGRSKKIDPYVHALFGGMYATTSIAESSILIPVQPIVGAGCSGTRCNASQANFGMALGGGLDIRVAHHILFRPIQLDYMLTRFETPNFLGGNVGSGTTGTTSNKNQNYLRYSAGIAFEFGAR